MTNSLYKEGKRIRVLHMPEESLPSGTEGTIEFVDDLGTIHVKWDNGSQLGLVPELDRFELLS